MQKWEENPVQQQDSLPPRAGAAQPNACSHPPSPGKRKGNALSPAAPGLEAKGKEEFSQINGNRGLL